MHCAKHLICDRSSGILRRVQKVLQGSGLSWVPQGSPGFRGFQRGPKVSKFPKDPKLSKIFGIPKISKVLLHLQSFKVLHSSCLSSFPGSTGIAILQCFQLMLFSGYSTKGSSKGSSRNSRKALRKDNYFLTFRRTFEFS